MAMLKILFLIAILARAVRSTEKKPKEEASIKEPKEARHLSPYEPGLGYHHYGDFLTCTCGVFGPDGAVKRQLEQWVDSDYYHDGYSKPFRQCRGRACYRADFVGVSQGYGGYGGFDGHNGHNRYSDHRFHDHARYVVLGCMDPHFEPTEGGREIIDFTIKQNASLNHFLQNYHGGEYHKVRYVFEFLCTHYRCQQLDHAPWNLEHYKYKMEEVVYYDYNSSKRHVANGLGGVALAILSMIFAYGSF